MQFDAVVFDLDGVLVDTHGAWFEVRREFAQRHGGRWNYDDERAVMGVNSQQWADYMRDEAGVQLPSDHIYSGVVDELKRRYSEGLGVFTGAAEAVADLATRFRMGVASGSPMELIEHSLQIAGMRQHFELVVSADEVSHGKPLPDVYLLACSRLCIDPRRSAAVEDSGNGIKAAVAAGLAVVAIPNLEFPPAPEVVRLARVVLPAIAELTSATIDAIEMGSDV